MPGAIEADVLDVVGLVEAIKPNLAGWPPGVQGGVLADLLSMWLAGHAPALREQALAHLLEAAREMLPINEQIMFGEAGHPAGL